uniref:Uncharacterized protein n=1 Tax=Xenopus tropicalis TaxID=8364 RepID=A0A1B8XWQ4_XENTR
MSHECCMYKFTKSFQFQEAEEVFLFLNQALQSHAISGYQGGISSLLVVSTCLQEWVTVMMEYLIFCLDPFMENRY